MSIVENLRQNFPEALKPPPESAIALPGYGGLPKLRDFTLRARRTIVRAGALIGRGEARSRTLFLTGTLPGGTDEALEAISRYSSWIVHQIMSVLPRLAGCPASDLRILWVWEWQKRGALHWHGVVEAPTRDSARAVYDGFKALWIQLLESVGARLGIDMAQRAQGGTHAGDYEVWRTRPEWARKNPARYLAKYLGKLKASSSVSQKYPPCRWYQVNRKLLSELRLETVTVSTATGSRDVDYRIKEEVDLPLLERLFGLSHKVSHFPDKVRDGYTFVFYVSDENRLEVEKIMRGFEPQELEDFMRFGGTGRPVFYGLKEVARHPVFLERFLQDVGAYYRSLYHSWASGERIPDVELFWLDHYAHAILHRAGWSYRGKPPQREPRGLPGRDEPIIDSLGAGRDDVDQPSLFP